jgi:hypothetical protein
LRYCDQHRQGHAGIGCRLSGGGQAKVGGVGDGPISETEDNGKGKNEETIPDALSPPHRRSCFSVHLRAFCCGSRPAARNVRLVSES